MDRLKREVSAMIQNVHWTGHSGIKIKGSKTVYVDPYELTGNEKADLILVTHDHYDHCSSKDIKKILKPGTTVVIPESTVDIPPGTIRTVMPGDRITIDGVEIRAIPMYNIGKRFHPREKQFTAFVFKMDRTTYFHAGDSDLTPEVESVRADVVFLPVSGVYCMNAREAADACNKIGPKAAVPIHWGSVTGSSDDAKEFKKLAKCDVFILPQE